jgi:hypothetical protein
MKAVIDQIEEEWIVLVDDKSRSFAIPRECFFEAEEGDHIEIVVTKDNADQMEAEKRIQNLRTQLKRISIGNSQN